MRLGVLYIALFLGLFSAASSMADDSTQAKIRLLYFSSFPEIRQPAGSAGLAQLASAVKAKSAEVPESYFINGGASLGPSVLGSMDAGAHMVDLLNAINPTMMAVAKKEFSYGFDQFIVNALSASFPMVSSNIVDADTGRSIDATDSDYFIETPDLNIGFIVLTSAAAVSEYGAKQISILETDSVVASKSEQLRDEGADAVILMADTDFEGLGYLQENGLVDVIFYAHNFDNPVSIDNRGQQYSRGPLDGYLIVLDIWHENNTDDKSADNNTTLKTEVSFVDIRDASEDPATEKLVQDYQNRLGQLLGKPIASLKQGFDTFRDNVRSHENAFANIVTAAMRNVTNADAAMLNAGSVRGNVAYEPNQQINRGDIQRELPFENRTVVVELTGDAIRQTLEYSINCGLRKDGCFVHFDNIRMTYDGTLPEGQRIKSLMLAGAELSKDKKYRIVVPNFMAEGNDGFVWLDGAPQIPTEGVNRLIWRVVADYAAGLGSINSITDSRIQNIAGQAETPAQ